MEFKKRLSVTFALLLLALVPHWRTVLVGEYPFPEGYLALIAPELKNNLMPTAWNAIWWDSIGQFWAWRTEAMRQLDKGMVPLWTDRVGCGFPFLANPQTQSLYLPTLLGSFALEFAQEFGFGKDEPLPLRSARLMAWLALLHTLLALTGTYLLIRSFGTSRLASLVGASAYGLGSFQTAWALLPTLPATASWLPLTLWLMRRFLGTFGKAGSSSNAYSGYSKHRTFNLVAGYALGFSLSLTMLLLAGHGQIAIYALLAIFTFTFVEALVVCRVRVSVSFLAFAPFAFAFMLAAVQLLPALELSQLTHRHGPPTWEGYKAFTARGLTPADWATMALPFLFGNPVDGSYFGKESFADYCAYAGMGILVLAGLRVWSWLTTLGKRYSASSPALLHSLVLFALGALLASGSTFNFPLYFLLPGFSQLGTPTRAVFLCQLALGMMAAEAIDKTVKRSVNKLAVIAATLILPIALVFAVGVWLSSWADGFDWLAWLALNIAQNKGVLLGVFAVLLFSLLQLRGANLPITRYGVAILLIGELSWFAAQQIQTARPSMVREALEVAQGKLGEILKQIPDTTMPCRILFIGGDWSLIRYPQSLLPPNSTLLFGEIVCDVRNYDSLLLRHYKAVMALFSEGNACPLENGNMVLMPQRWVNPDSARKLAKLTGANTIVNAFGGRLQVLEVPPIPESQPFKQPRVFVPLKVRYVPELDKVFEQLPGCPGDTALLVARPRNHFGEVERSVQVIVDKGALVRLRATSNAVKPFWLVISDTFYPGWLAFQKPGDEWRLIPKVVANGAFRACHLSGANGEIVWVYFPSSFVVGSFLSFVGVFCFAALCVYFLGSASDLALPPTKP
ncbi:MAG: hypothetical protein ACUVTP_09025 [Candidatus Fervidibacter sp.]|uniref:hypothetical protein n=1 Tax=Candidatus Fervidibacter sp. TaxID=3100871 RepID=UPI0040498519